MNYALINATIYTGFSVLHHHAVVVDGENITGIFPVENLPTGIETVDLHGANLCAGFIDLQINGCGGVMFNDDICLETLETMHATNLKSGTTSFLPTFITSSDKKIKQAIQVMGDYLATHTHQALGLHLEGPYLSVAKKGVHREEYIRKISPEMKDYLCKQADKIKMITLAPENPSAEFIPDFVKHGIVVSLGHSNATFEEAQHAIQQGASCATHLHNAMSPIISGRELGMVGAVLYHPIYAGIIADGLHVHFANVALDKKIKGEKLFMVTDAIAPAGSTIQQFKFEGKDIFVKNGQCVDKNGTLAGASVTLIQSIENAVKHVGITLEEAIKMCTLYPAQVIHMQNKLGAISRGMVANLTAFDQNFHVIGTAVNGKWAFQ